MKLWLVFFARFMRVLALIIRQMLEATCPNRDVPRLEIFQEFLRLHERNTPNPFFLISPPLPIKHSYPF